MMVIEKSSKLLLIQRVILMELDIYSKSDCLNLNFQKCIFYLNDVVKGKLVLSIKSSIEFGELDTIRS